MLDAIFDTILNAKEISKLGLDKADFYRDQLFSIEWNINCSYLNAHKYIA